MFVPEVAVRDEPDPVLRQGLLVRVDEHVVPVMHVDVTGRQHPVV